MVATLQSQPHIGGMNPDAGTPYIPGKQNDARSAIDPHALNAKATQAARDTSPFPILPASSSIAVNINKYRYSSKSAMVHASGPSAAETQTSNLQPPATHTPTLQKQIPPRTDCTPTPPPAFVPSGHPLIEPQPHEGEEEMPVPLPPLSSQNAFPDPWSSELAHTFPGSVRPATMANILDDLEPLLYA